MTEKNPVIVAEAKIANKKTAGRGRTQKAPVWKVLDDARKKFDAQIVKNTQVKRECIKASIGKHYADELRFWYDYTSQTENMLLDSVRFNKFCEGLGLDPRNVSEHIVFESKKIAERVAIEGVSAVLGERVKMFGDPLIQGKEKLNASNGSDGQKNPSEAKATSGSDVSAA